MATIAGRNAAVYLQGGAGTVAVPLGEARSWRIDIDQDLESSTPSTSVWATWIRAVLSWSIEVEGNLDTADNTPLTAINVGAKREMYLYPDRSTTARYYYGYIWPKLSVEVGRDRVVRYTLEGVGEGELAEN